MRFQESGGLKEDATDRKDGEEDSGCPVKNISQPGDDSEIHVCKTILCIHEDLKKNL